MTQAFDSLLPIFFALIAGFIIGKFLPNKISLRIGQWITPFVWFLLFAIGSQFGKQLEVLQNLGQILGLALSFSLTLTVFTGIGTYLVLHPKKQERSIDHHNMGISKVIKECGVALSFLMAGFLLTYVLMNHHTEVNFIPSTETFLYILLFLIGIDIVHAPLSKNLITKRTLAIPFISIIFSLLGGSLLAYILGMDIRHGLVLGGGFGWFSLSGVLVTSQLGSFYGALSLMTDLFRELISIVVLFFFAARFPSPSIATAGATAMDTTLPIIKKAAGNQFIAEAIFVGLSLSIVAPFLLSYLLSLFK